MKTNDMNEPEQIAAAHKFLVQWTAILGIIAVIACGYLIWQGETQQGEWATFQTINSPPSIEIIP